MHLLLIYLLCIPIQHRSIYTSRAAEISVRLRLFVVYDILIFYFYILFIKLTLCAKFT
jgi:hypothetical protein